MKCVILAGGKGTRLSEETNEIPKPMIEIGERPIIWHIMKHYSVYGINEFIICAGYKSNYIKNYFVNYKMNNSVIHVDINRNTVDVDANVDEKWKISIIDTGLETNTAGRIKKVAKYITDENFLLTYGDGVGNVDIAKSIKFHLKHKKLVTMTAAIPEGRFGSIMFKGDRISSIKEKQDNSDKYVNAGFFVVNKKAIKYISNNNEQWEKAPLRKIAASGNLMGFKHCGFWHPMDTLRDKTYLEDLSRLKNPPWKTW